MGLFGDTSELKAAKALAERIARSFLRGSVDDSHEARLALMMELRSASARLSAKERDHLADYRPRFFAGLLPEAQRNYLTWIRGALEK